MKIEEKIMFFLKRTRDVEKENITMFGNIFLAKRFNAIKIKILSISGRWRLDYRLEAISVIHLLFTHFHQGFIQLWSYLSIYRLSVDLTFSFWCVYQQDGEMISISL